MEDSALEETVQTFFEAFNRADLDAVMALYDGAPVRMEHTSADVLRRQADGRWLFVIDNPWGTSILQ
jgi:ketosteroid isomerase-like protein